MSIGERPVLRRVESTTVSEPVARTDGVDGTPEAGNGEHDAPDRAHLERSGRMWDRWARFYGTSERDFAPILDAAVERLDIGPGDTVLEIGCGPGTNFERLHDLVGPEGRIVAVDYSEEMVDRARERAGEHGFDNVDVIRADASRVSFDGEQFDGALASLSLSVMPDPESAARRVRAAVVPGGRFVVVGLRPVPSGPLRVVNPLLTRFFRWFANWNSDADALAALQTVFEAVDVEEDYAAGVAYRALACEPGEPA